MTSFPASYTQLAKEMLEKLGQNFQDPVHTQEYDGGYCWEAQKDGKTEYAFEMTGNTLRFGPGVTKEVGYDIKNFGSKNPVIITDKNMKKTEAFRQVEETLKNLDISYEVFDKVKCEPALENAIEVVDFCRKKNFDCFIAVGGGSTIDTTKIAALYVSNPEANILDFLIIPFGNGLLPKNKTLPIIAIPTTAGTGSECTAAAVLDIPDKKCKCGIRVRAIKPHLSLVDPLNVMSMPRNVTIYSGFDVLCHALESFTNRPYHKIVHKYFRRAVFDPTDVEARAQMQLAACYAGMGIGNAGVHFCHGLSYPISSQGKFSPKPYIDPEYDGHPLIPHGLSVIVTAPAVFQFTVWANPDRHLEAAKLLGADLTDNATPDHIGNTLAEILRGYMKDFGVPNGLSELGFDKDSLENLAGETASNFGSIFPIESNKEIISKMYELSWKVY